MRFVFIYRVLFFLFIVCFAKKENTFAQPYRISLLTCGVGEELYASFGHSAIRVIDSSSGADDSYNYGMFNFGDEGFYLKFVRGTLPYFSAKAPTAIFLQEYVESQREVKEQVLLLDSASENKIIAMLEKHLREPYKYYKYDFLFHNCSTKLRDVMDSCFGAQLKWGAALPQDSLTFMQMLNSYLPQQHWERVGINLILSSEVNNNMSNRESMFLPEWLSKNVGAATLNSKPLCAPYSILVSGLPQHKQERNMPRIFFAVFAAIILLGTFFVNNSALWKWVDAFFFGTLGLLGLLFLFMHFGTDHLETKRNAIMLWALPTHVLFAYWQNSKYRKSYASISLVLLAIGVVLHLFFQYMAPEVWPVIAAAGARLWAIRKATTPLQ